jgi:hypothetical protein
MSLEPSSLRDKYNPLESLFGPSRKGLINSIGGQSEIRDSDTIEIIDKGILLRHNDAMNSMTFFPWSTIVWVRMAARHPNDTEYQEGFK